MYTLWKIISESSSRQDSAKHVLDGGECCERREGARATTRDRGLCATVMQSLNVSPSLLSLYHSINRLENQQESHRLLLLTLPLHLYTTSSWWAPRAGPHSSATFCRGSPARTLFSSAAV